MPNLNKLSNLIDLTIETGLVEHFEVSSDTLMFTITTRKGLVDFIAQLELLDNEETQHLKDIAVYAQSEVPFSGIQQEIFKTRTLLINIANRLGFKRLRMTGMRHQYSTSANPGHLINLNIDLTKFTEP